MNQDIKKFIELLKTDESLQEQMKAAAEKYEGNQMPEAAFKDLVLSIAQEAGFHFTWEDLQEYVKQEAEKLQELSADEMSQVAGGSSGGGLGACLSAGLGIGFTGEFFCLVIGGGEGASICAVKGVGVSAE